MSKAILFYFKKLQSNQIMFSHFEELALKTTLFPSAASLRILWNAIVYMVESSESTHECGRLDFWRIKCDLIHQITGKWTS